MKNEITRILVDSIGREEVDKFIEDEEGNLIGFETISLEELSSKIADVLDIAKKQAVREFAEKLKENLEDIVNLAVSNSWGAAYEYVNKLLAEVTGENGQTSPN